jgi:membrane fusion protein (multidrug efflux system)
VGQRHPKRIKHMASKVIYTVVAVVGIATASTVAWWYQKGASNTTTNITGGGGAGPTGGGAGRPVGVELAKVQKQTLRDDAEAVGTLRSRQNVMLRPEVAGRILALGFADGARVSAGQVLVQLDDTLQRAEVQQSLAQMSIAKANYKRNQELVAQNFVAQRVLDESAASLQVAEAQLGLSCARLERMRIVAPFAGVVGIRNINVGDFVKDGAELINLEDIGTLYVDYRLPERYQAKLAVGQTIELRLDAVPNRLYKANLEAIDPTIDANGRSIGVRAILPNGPGEPIAARPAGGPGGQGASPSASAPAPAAASASAKPAGANQPNATGGDRASSSAGGKPAVAPAANNRVSSAIQLASPQSLGCPPNVFERARVQPLASAQGGPLRPGMFARVTAVFAVKPNALVVPEEAIVPQGGRQFVIKAVAYADLPAQPASAASGAVASGNPSGPTASAAPPASAASAPAPDALVSQRVEVKLGIRRAGQVEITEGLKEGEQIVIAGQQRLQKDGTVLRVVELGRGPANAASAAASSASATSANSASASAASGAASR